MLFKKHILTLLIIVLYAPFNLCMEEPTSIDSAIEKPSKVIPLKLLAIQYIILNLLTYETSLKDLESLPLELYQAIKIFILQHYGRSYNFIAFPKLRLKFIGHSQKITACCLHNNKPYALTGSEDSTIRLWDTESGNCLKLFEGHNTPITALAFHDHQPLFASGSADGKVKIWDMEAGEWMYDIDNLFFPESSSSRTCINTLYFINHHLYLQNSVTLIECDSSDKNMFLIYESSNLTDRTKNFEIRYGIIALPRNSNLSNDDTYFKDFQGNPLCCKISHNEQIIATCADNNTIYLWDRQTGNLLHSFTHPTHSFFAVNFNDNDTKLIAACCSISYLVLFIWDIATGTLINQHVNSYDGRIPNDIQVCLKKDGSLKYHISFNNSSHSTLLERESFYLNNFACKPYRFLKITKRGSIKSNKIVRRRQKKGEITVTSKETFSPMENIDILIGCENGDAELWRLVEGKKLSLKQLIFILRLAQIALWYENSNHLSEKNLKCLNEIKKDAKTMLLTFEISQKHLILRKYPFLETEE